MRVKILIIYFLSLILLFLVLFKVSRLMIIIVRIMRVEATTTLTRENYTGTELMHTLVQ